MPDSPSRAVLVPGTSAVIADLADRVGVLADADGAAALLAKADAALAGIVTDTPSDLAGALRALRSWLVSVAATGRPVSSSDPVRAAHLAALLVAAAPSLDLASGAAARVSVE